MRQLPAVVYKVLALYTVYLRHFHQTALRFLSPFVWSACIRPYARARKNLFRYIQSFVFSLVSQVFSFSIC